MGRGNFAHRSQPSRFPHRPWMLILINKYQRPIIFSLSFKSLQLGSSSRAIHGGAYFSAVFGQKFNPTTVLRPCQPLACYWRVGIAAAPTLFTTSAKHHGSRWCGWSDLSLLFTRICSVSHKRSLIWGRSCISWHCSLSVALYLHCKFCIIGNHLTGHARHLFRITNTCEQKWQIWPSTSTGTMVFCWSCKQSWSRSNAN